MYVSLFFFFKQKTAYEMRISDWSSDVCSSDFSSPGALEATLDACIAAKTPIVIGTTGLEERHHWLIDDAAKDIAVLQTGNTSLGVTLLAHLVREAASRLDAAWDIEIVEMQQDLKSVVSGKRVYVRFVMGGWRRIKKKKK